jgi:hypothetical protein
MEKIFNIKSLIEGKSQIYYRITGITKENLKVLSEYVFNEEQKETRGLKSSFTVEERITITFIMMRHNYTYCQIADLINIQAPGAYKMTKKITNILNKRCEEIKNNEIESAFLNNTQIHPKKTQKILAISIRS